MVIHNSSASCKIATNCEDKNVYISHRNCILDSPIVRHNIVTFANNNNYMPVIALDQTTTWALHLPPKATRSTT